MGQEIINDWKELSLPETAYLPYVEQMAATRITAAVKGYLTRRLFRTGRVQEIILMIRDTLLCAVQINQECWPDVTPEDVALHRRLIHQVSNILLLVPIIF